MIEQIRTLAAHLFRPSTQVFDVGSTLGFAAMLDLEPVTPILYVWSHPNTWTPRDATESELQDVLTGLQSLPILRPLMSKLEIMAIFTEDEKTAIRDSAPGLIEMLIAATDPVSSSAVLPHLRSLKAANILAAQRFTAITGEAA